MNNKQTAVSQIKLAGLGGRPKVGRICHGMGPGKASAGYGAWNAHRQRTSKARGITHAHN
jgi:hypothetical protein